MTARLAATDLRRMRMTALGLNPAAPLPSPGPAAAVERLLALQGQDFPAAQWGLALRSRLAGGAGTAAEVRAAFDAGELVRSWPMRGTVHVLAPHDIGWMQTLTNPRVLAGWPKRREFLELDLETFERARALAVEALAGGGRMSRAALLAHWQDAGIELRTGWSYHLVWALNQTGTLLFGPGSANDRDLDLVLAADWVAAPRLLDGDEALAELTARYLRGHSPATAADIAWWAGISQTEVKRGLARSGAHEVDAGPLGRFWMHEDQHDAPPVPRGTLHLLGAFDEHLLGFKNRSLHVDPAFTSDVMTKNGIGAATIVLDGRVIGVWRPAELSHRYLGDPPSAATQRRVDRELQRFEAFRAAS